MKFEKIEVAANANKEAVVEALARANEVIGQANAHIEQHEAALQSASDKSNQLLAELEQVKLQLAKANDELEKARASADTAKRSQHAGKGTHVRVSSAHPAGSHWRAGQLWSRDAKDVEVKSFSQEQLAAMRADRNLVVVDL